MSSLDSFSRHTPKVHPQTGLYQNLSWKDMENSIWYKYDIFIIRSENKNENNMLKYTSQKLKNNLAYNSLQTDVADHAYSR
jgi:hypothetical protein